MKMRINQKLVIAYMLIFTVPSVLLSVFFYHSLKSQEEKDRLHDVRISLTETVEKINKNIDVICNLQWHVTSDYKLMDFIAPDSEKQSMDYVVFNRETINDIELIMQLNPNLYQVRIFTCSREVLEICPHLYQISRLQENGIYAEISVDPSASHWRMNHVEETMIYNKTPAVSVVSFYKAIYFPRDRFVGILEITMQDDNFWEENRTSASHTMILSGRDQQIYTIGKKPFIPVGDLTPQDIWDSMEPQANGGIIQSRLLSVGDQTFAAACIYMDRLDAYVMHITDVSYFTESLQQKRNWTIFVTVLLLAVVASVTGIATKILMNRLFVIHRYVNRIQHGDLDVEIPVEGRDELSSLAESFNKMVKSIKVSINRAIQEETAAKSAELGALQAQIDSHFLYNTLEHIKMKAVLADEYDLARYITMLGKMMKYNLNWKSHFVRLGDELYHIQNYFGLVNIRFGHRFSLHIEVPEQYHDMKVHKMILQPLIENSITHGLEGEESGEILVSASQNSGYLELSVRDTGKGFDAKELQKRMEREQHEKQIGQENNGIALKNAYERLKLYYGDDAEIALESDRKSFASVTIRIKLDRIENYDKDFGS